MVASISETRSGEPWPSRLLPSGEVVVCWPTRVVGAIWPPVMP